MKRTNIMFTLLTLFQQLMPSRMHIDIDLYYMYVRYVLFYVTKIENMRNKYSHFGIRDHQNHFACLSVHVCVSEFQHIRIGPIHVLYRFSFLPSLWWVDASFFFGESMCVIHMTSTHTHDIYILQYANIKWNQIIYQLIRLIKMCM